ncbi:UNVERIFIED_CONTAM: hypothetical protein FQV15_0011732, partial [Eudyptes pachyrhynchus]
KTCSTDREMLTRERTELQDECQKLNGEKEIEELREKNKQLVTEKELSVQRKEKSETKLVETIKEKESLCAETEQLASSIERLKSDF